MALFGGSSSKSTTNQTTTQIDRRIGAADGSRVVAPEIATGENSSNLIEITETDHGAIGRSLDTVAATTIGAFELLGASQASAIEAIQSNADKALAFAQESRKEAGALTFEATVRWAVFAALGYFAMRAVVK